MEFGATLPCAQLIFVKTIINDVRKVANILNLERLNVIYSLFTQRAVNDSNISGANSTIVAMDYTENANTVFALNQRFVKAGSDIMCDENPAYKSLDFHYIRWSVNHQEAYSAKNVSNNLAESFNAGMCDLMRGTHHKTDNKYALHYANKAAFFSDTRRESNGKLFEAVLKRCLWVLPFKEWGGYWLGNYREGELLGIKPLHLTKFHHTTLSDLKNKLHTMKF